MRLSHPTAKATVLFVALLTASYIKAQSVPDHELPTIVSESSIVLVDVISVDPTTHRPANLKLEDFEVLDNGKPVHVTSFDTGAQFQARPLNLWIVVQCHYREWPDDKGSGHFAGSGPLFAPAFKFLDKPDKVGIAHWCDDGSAKLDLLPVNDTDLVLKKFAGMFQPMRIGAPRVSRDGELAFQKLLRLIVEDTRNTKPQPLPIVLILHDDWTGMPQQEADKVIGELLDTSGFVFGIRDARSPVISAIPGEVDQVFHYFAAQTGGKYLNALPDTYAMAMADILQQLHFRYQLGFRPPLIDGKRHTVKVQFTPAAASAHKNVRLSFRSEYLAVKHPASK